MWYLFKKLVEMVLVTLYNLLQSLAVRISSFSKKKIHLDGRLECSYLESTFSNERKSILIIHGYSTNAVSYLDIVKWFDLTRYHVILVDLINHGESSQLDKSVVKVEEMVEFLRMFVRKSSLKDRKFYLVGHSMGGYVSLNYARAEPSQLRGLCMLAPLGVEQTTDQRWKDWDASKPIEGGVHMRRAITIGTSHCELPIPNWVYPLMAANFNRRLRQHRAVMVGIIKDRRITDDELDSVKDMPKLLVWGENDLLLPCKPGVEFFKEKSPSTKIHVLEKGNHLFAEQFQFLVDIIQKWTEEV